MANGNANMGQQLRLFIARELASGFKTEKSGWSLVLALIAVGIITLIGRAYGDYLGLINMGMLYMLPVVISASRCGVWGALTVAMTSVLCLDIFFVPPLLFLTVSDPRYLITFVVFMMVAYTTGNMADMLRQRIRQAVQNEQRARVLYELAQGLSAVNDSEILIRKIAVQVAEILNAETALYLPDHEGQLKVAAASSALGDLVLGPIDLLAAQWTYNNAAPSGKGSDKLPGARGYHVPIRTEDKILGVLGVIPSHELLSPEQRDLIEALAGLSALAIVRLELAAEAQEIKILEDSERLRAALFDSISHDMKTPLSSILGAVSSLIDEGNLYSDDQKLALLGSIRQGSLRMNRLVNNLLDMARLESGYMKLNADWSDIQDIIGVTLRENREILKGFSIKVSVSDKNKVIKIDYALIEQVLTNLLHNAVKHSPLQGEIEISVAAEPQNLLVSVADRGTGIPLGDEEKIFDKFYRLQSPGNVGGTGLGLSICRGIIEAHGGKIWAINRPKGGSRFTFTLPFAVSLQNASNLEVGAE